MVAEIIVLLRAGANGITNGFLVLLVLIYHIIRVHYHTILFSICTIEVVHLPKVVQATEMNTFNIVSDFLSSACNNKVLANRKTFYRWMFRIREIKSWHR